MIHILVIAIYEFMKSHVYKTCPKGVRGAQHHNTSRCQNGSACRFYDLQQRMLDLPSTEKEQNRADGKNKRPRGVQVIFEQIASTENRAMHPCEE